MVSDIKKCQTVFSIDNDVPTCSGSPDGTCLTKAQKTVLAAVHAGAKNTAGQPLYTNFPWDPGIIQPRLAHLEVRQQHRSP